MTVRIGLIGTGTVGGGCIDIWKNHREDFKRHYGIDIEIVRVCSLDRSEAEAHGVGDLFTDNFNEIINDPDIDMVIELIGGTGVAHTIVTNALKAGKYVVTANKALMATAGGELFNLADEAGVEIGDAERTQDLRVRAVADLGADDEAQHVLDRLRDDIDGHDLTILLGKLPAEMMAECAHTDDQK